VAWASPPSSSGSDAGAGPRSRKSARGCRFRASPFDQGRKAGAEPTTATTARVKDGKTLRTDGPFAETREQLGGFYVIEAKDLDEAVTIAARIPGAKTGCVEVRPILKIPGM
jgi:hypothetical protein